MEKEKYKRDFDGVWIPKKIWLSRDLTLQEKCFLVEIKSLDNNASCYAGNQHFADFFDLSKSRVSTVISSLVKKGYITSKIKYKEGTKEIEKRVLAITGMGYEWKQVDPIRESSDTLYVETPKIIVQFNNTDKHKEDTKVSLPSNKVLEIGRAHV